jgi:hypothetical protein
MGGNFVIGIIVSRSADRELRRHHQAPAASPVCPASPWEPCPANRWHSMRPVVGLIDEEIAKSDRRI